MPNTVIYDVDLTLSLPVRIAAVSGMNALAHSVEALYAKDRNPVVSLVAADAIRAMVGALPDIAREPDDRDARSRALYGAWLSGLCLEIRRHGAPSQALPRPRRNLQSPACGNTRDRAAACDGLQQPCGARGRKKHLRNLGSSGSAAGLFDFACRLGIPASLREIGMP